MYKLTANYKTYHTLVNMCVDLPGQLTRDCKTGNKNDAVSATPNLPFSFTSKKKKKYINFLRNRCTLTKLKQRMVAFMATENYGYSLKSVILQCEIGDAC